MKKLDKLVLGAFLSPFIGTFAVVVFILLTQYMLKYFEDFVGKDLGAAVFAELLFYFSINMMPLALPLSVLLASLIAFGNLGEHNELTAIKTSGITLWRVILPVFIVVVGLTVGSLVFNDQVVPKANLRAYSLLYDIRQKKPALDLRPGVFYNGLPGYSVKANKKGSDGKTIGDIMIYDHTANRGDVNVTLADSGKMYTIYDDRYLVLELFRGRSYAELVENNADGREFVQNSFAKSKFLFSLASFDLNRTQVELFSQNRMMHNIGELHSDLDSIGRERNAIQTAVNSTLRSYFFYLYRRPMPEAAGTQHPPVLPITDSIRKVSIPIALNQARNAKSFIAGYAERYANASHDLNLFSVEVLRKYTQAAAVLVLFLIGAPLGAIIRKGGLGVPVLISIVFFVLYYILSITGEKWAKEGVGQIVPSMWYANVVLLVVGLFFLNQARNDRALFELDFYRRFFSRLFGRKSKPKMAT